MTGPNGIERRRGSRVSAKIIVALVVAALVGILGLTVLTLLDRAGIVEEQDRLDAEQARQALVVDEIVNNRQQGLNNRRLLLCIGRAMAGHGGGARTEYLTTVCLMSPEEAEFIRGERDDLPPDVVTTTTVSG